VFAIGNDLLVGGPSAAHRNVISGNDGDGVEVAHTGGAEGVQVVGNFIGTDATGTRALGNSGDGVEPISGSNIWIGRPASRPGVAPGNVISGNRGNGIHVPTNLSASAVDGNLVGTNARGIAAVPNRLNGLAIFDGTNATLAGAEGPNVFSGNGRAGILITGTTNNAVVYDSLIGTNRAGTEAVPNRVGIEIRGSGSHSIGDPGAGNVISGNRGAGVSIRGLTSAIVLIGNRIGLAEATARPVPNGKGVVIAGPAAPNYIGFAGEPPNTIAGNRGPAIVLAQGAGGAPQGTQIAANRIGVTGSGKARPNRGPGILIDGATETTVGGNDPAAGNTIARNRGAGVAVRSGTGNLIRANSLFGNGGIGIDLGPSGATPNDPDDPDGGANRRQNSPVITSVSFASGVTTIEGHLNSVPSEAFVLDFYKTRSARAGAAEGRTHLGSANAATDAGGDVTFSFEVAGRVAGVWLRATATRTITGDTSELGRARRAPSRPGTSQTTPRGGSVTSAENGCSCHGCASATTPPTFPAFEPP
jgi:hypothetical protein